jgi:hypothetical protein
MEHYDSAEVGARLADAVEAAAAAGQQAASVARASALEQDSTTTAAAAAEQQLTQQLPRMAGARLVQCLLPGGWAFWLAARGSAFAAPALVAPAGGLSLLSVTATGATDPQNGGGAGGEGAPGGVLNLVVDARGMVCQVSALARRGSPLAAAAPVLRRLVGLPFSYLAAGLGLDQTVLARAAGPGHAPVEAGVDVAAALLGARWAEALRHDGLGALREVLLRRCICAREGGGASRGESQQGAVEGVVAAEVVAWVQAAPAGELEGMKQRLLAVDGLAS